MSTGIKLQYNRHLSAKRPRVRMWAAVVVASCISVKMRVFARTSCMYTLWSSGELQTSQFMLHLHISTANTPLPQGHFCLICFSCSCTHGKVCGISLHGLMGVPLLFLSSFPPSCIFTKTPHAKLLWRQEFCILVHLHSGMLLHSPCRCDWLRFKVSLCATSPREQ